MSLVLAAPAPAQLYVGSSADDRVKRFDAQTGAFLGESPQLPATPFGLALGADGLLYVAVDGNANHVRRLNPQTGADLGQFSQGGNMAGITFGPGGDLFVVDAVPGDIGRFDGATGAFEGIFAGGGGLSGARGLVVGPWRRLLHGAQRREPRPGVRHVGDL